MSYARFKRKVGFRPLRPYNPADLEDKYNRLAKVPENLELMVNYLMLELKDDWGHWHTDKDQWNHMRDVFTRTMVDCKGAKYVRDVDELKLAMKVVKGIKAKKVLQAELFKRLIIRI